MLLYRSLKQRDGCYQSLLPSAAGVATHNRSNLLILGQETEGASTGGFPRPPIRRAALLATPPCRSVPLSLLQSWLLLDHFPPTSERTPSAARSPDRFPPHFVESPVSPEAVVGCYLRSLSPSLPRIVIYLSERAVLLEQERPKFLRLAPRYLPKDIDPEDCVSDAPVLALRFAGNFRGESSLGTWFGSIVRTCAFRIMLLKPC